MASAAITSPSLPVRHFPDHDDDDDGVHGERMKPLSVIGACAEASSLSQTRKPRRGCWISRKRAAIALLSSASQMIYSTRRRAGYAHSYINRENKRPCAQKRSMRELKPKWKAEKKLKIKSQEHEGLNSKRPQASSSGNSCKSTCQTSAGNSQQHENPLASSQERRRLISRGCIDIKPHVYHKPKRGGNMYTSSHTESVRAKHHSALVNPVDISSNVEDRNYQIESSPIASQQDMGETYASNFPTAKKGSFFREQKSLVGVNSHRHDSFEVMTVLPLYGNHRKPKIGASTSSRKPFDSSTRNLAFSQDSANKINPREPAKENVMINVRKRPFQELNKNGDILMGGLNPGIINKVRDRKQVRAVLYAIIGSSSVMQSEVRSEQIQSQHRDLHLNCEQYNWWSHKRSKKDNENIVCKEESNSTAPSSSVISCVKNGQTYKTENDPYRKVSENRKANYETKNVARDKTPVNDCEGDVALCWLELLRLDIKGRLCALKRSRGRLRSILLSGLIDEKSNLHGAEQLKKPINWDNIGNDWNEMHKWRAFFLHMDSVLFSEGLGLENWLNQVTEMQSQSRKMKGS